ncbi:PucR family transcriptional regulator ligand-binding domain-containing protein [Moorella naiadis]|uniref:PucR family transcriptional regulator ligand-binding domain-containing protein n=1 Tax=Moorella naiadis (nom. illeg.) TaxID=3093670 RepID=UPI003D9CBA8A
MGMQGVSLLKILTSTEMLGASVVAGWEGLGRRVTSLAVVEAPVAMEWLKGGELVLTTGYYLHGDKVIFINFINKLVEIGAAGVAIPPRSFIGIIPDEVIHKADELMFPVISLPINSTFWKVAQTLIMELAVNEPPRDLTWSGTYWISWRTAWGYRPSLITWPPD